MPQYHNHHHLGAIATKILALMLAFVSPSALACECLWQGSFKNVLDRSDLVIYGEVIASKGNSVDVKISEVLRGKEFREEVRIWGKKDQLCRPDAAEFPVGSQWVMALQRIENIPQDGFDPFNPNTSFGRVEDFSLSNCGVYWLPVNEERVSGNIVSAPRWQYLDPKKSPVILPVFKAWLSHGLPDKALVEAARPQTEARKLLNNSRMFLWQQERESNQNE